MRNGTNASIRLQEAMALLIRNQAAFVEQISRNDQERLDLQRKAKEWQRKSDERPYLTPIIGRLSGE